MKEARRPGLFHRTAYLAGLFLGGMFGWRVGNELSGTVLGIIFAIVGALLLSSLVGIVAHLLGYRMD